MIPGGVLRGPLENAMGTDRFLRPGSNRNNGRVFLPAGNQYARKAKDRRSPGKASVTRGSGSVSSTERTVSLRATRKFLAPGVQALRSSSGRA
jgi:hypothetical protein